MRTFNFDVQRFATVVSLSSDGEFYQNEVSNIKILALGGNDSIYSGWNTDRIANITIDGGAGNDTIRNYDKSSFVSIDAGADNDVIDNRGSNVTIDAGTGDDTISNQGSNVTIDAGTGDNTISNSGGSYIKIESGTGRDSVRTYGSNVTIATGSGNDTIENLQGDSLSIDGGDDDDFITNGDEYYSYHVGNELTIKGGKGNDTISSRGNKNFIDGGEGNDSITSYGGGEVTINGGVGDDFIYGSGNDITIDAGAGADTVSLYSGNKILVKYSGGNDTILKFNKSATLQIAEGTLNPIASLVGSNSDWSPLFLGVGQDTIRLENFRQLNKEDYTHFLDKDGNQIILTQIDIIGTDDADSLTNSTASSTIRGFGGNDTIINSGNDAKIYDGDGDDSIKNQGASSVIELGAGADTVQNFAQYTTIIGSEDNDSILNTYNDTLMGGDDVSIVAGNGANIIHNNCVKVTIDAGTGNNRVFNSGGFTSIKTSSGDDFIENNKKSSYPYVGVGGNNSTIESGAGNDTIKSYATNVTIDAGTGSDSISISGSYVSVNGGDDDDFIYSSRIIRSNNGMGQETIYSDHMTIDGGKGNDYIYNVGANVSISGGENNDTIISTTNSDTTIDAGNGDDSIENSGSSASISAGEGNDSIGNTSANVTIGAGDGDDSIRNSGSSASISSGEGNDYIYNSSNGGMNTTINAGAGNDTIHNSSCRDITISAGTGDDYIENEGSLSTNVTFNYNAGDGNDTIIGFNSTSTLIIGDGKGTYSSTKSGSDIVITVGEGSISLNNAANLPTINIVGVEEEENPLLIVGTNDADTINYSLDGSTIKALGGNDYIYGEGDNVSISAGEGDDLINSNGSNVTIDAGADNDSVFNWGDKTSIHGGNGDDTIRNGLYINSWSPGGSNVTINGGKGDDSIDNVSGSATIIGGEGNDSIYFVSKEDNVMLNKACYDNLIIYNEGDGNDLISGFSENSTLQIGDGTGTYSTQRSGVDVIVTVGEDTITLKNALLSADSIRINDENSALSKVIELTGGDDKVVNDRASVSVDAGEGSDTIGNCGSNVTISGGAGDDSIRNINGTNVLFKYSEGDGNDTIGGFNDTSTLSIGGGTYSTQISGSDVIVTVGEGKITLTGAASLATLNIDGEKALAGEWTYKSSKATYKVDGKTLVTVSGVKSAEGLSIDDKTVTVSNAALNKTKVTVSGGYTLKLGDDVTDKAKLDPVDWSVSKGKATFTQATSAGYTCDGKTINYSKKKTTLTVATITNLNSKATKNDIELDDDTITLTENALTTDTKKLVALKGNGYTLAIDESLTSAEQDEFWTVSGTTATYGEGTPAHYDCTDTKITYKAATLDTTKLKLTGLKKNLTAKDMDEIQIDDDGTVTLDKSLLNKKTVTLAGTGYKLSDEGLAPETSTKWNGSKLLRTSTDGYKLNGTGTALTYTKAAKNQTIATVSGTKKNLSEDNYDEDTNTVKLANADLKAKVTVSGKTEFEFAEDYSGSITGSKAANTIAVAGVNVSVNAGKGNDTIDLGDGSATFFYASGDGNDVIANFTSGKDKIVVTKGKVKAAASGNDVVVTVGTGKITLTGAANQTFDIVNKSGTTLATYTATSNNLLYSDNYGTQPQIDSLLTESADYSLGEIETSNGTNLTQDKTQLTFGKK